MQDTAGDYLKSRNAAQAIFDNLKGRKGFDWIIDGLDDEIRLEIVQEFRDIIYGYFRGVR